MLCLKFAYTYITFKHLTFTPRYQGGKVGVTIYHNHLHSLGSDIWVLSSSIHMQSLPIVKLHQVGSIF